MLRSRLSKIPPALMVAISVLSLLIILMQFSPPNSFISPASPKQMMTQLEPAHGAEKPSPRALTGRSRPIVGMMEPWFDNGLYVNQQDAVAQQLLEANQYVTRRFGFTPAMPFRAELVQEPSCGLHGIAYTDVRRVQVFTCNDLPPERAVSIMAHEIVHQLSQDRYGAAHLKADLILSEGVATWGAGSYWLGRYNSFRAFVADQRRAGAYYPLATHYQGLGISAMNTLYYQWASFVEFLIETYGRASFDRVYISGSNAPGSADYLGVYGKNLPTLEQEWLNWLDE